MQISAIISWISDVLGLTVILANPNAPRPPRPYAVLRIDDMIDLGHSCVGDVDEDGIAQIQTQKEFTLSVSVIGSPDDDNNPLYAYNKVIELKDSMNLSTVKSIFRTNKLSIREKGQVLNMPMLMNTKYVERGIFDVRFGVAVSQEDDVGIIETAEGIMSIAGQKEFSNSFLFESVLIPENALLFKEQPLLYNDEFILYEPS